MQNFVDVVKWFGKFFASWFGISSGNFVLSLGEFLFAFGTFFSILALFFKGSGRGD